MKKQTKTNAKVSRSKVKAAYDAAYRTTLQDLKTAVLITSVLVNLYVLIGWLMLQTTDLYDAAIASMLF